MTVFCLLRHHYSDGIYSMCYRAPQVQREGAPLKSLIRECFVMKYDELVELAVMIVGDVAIAQDILHEVVINLLTKEDELNDVNNYLGFITVCIRRAALNYYRKNSRTEAHDPATMAEVLYTPSRAYNMTILSGFLACITACPNIEPSLGKPS